MNIEIIIGIPLLIKAIILGIQGILKAFLVFLRIQKEESVILHTIIHRPPFLLYVLVHYLITLSIPAFQLPLNLMTASHSSCHHITPCVIIY